MRVEHPCADGTRRLSNDAETALPAVADLLP